MVRIQTVCGFGLGSSLMLKMNIDTILKDNSIRAETFCGDVASCTSNDCSVIFISRDLGDRIKDRTKVPVVIIDNFMDKDEVRTKVLDYFSGLEKEGENE